MTPFERQKREAIVKLAEQANLIGSLIDLVRALKGVREPEPHASHYRVDDWFQAIKANSFSTAEQFIRAHGIVAPISPNKANPND